MLFFGHLGFTATLSEFIHYQTKRPKSKYHLLIVCFLAVVIDIIDKPLSIYFFPDYYNGRIFFHTILVNILLMLLLFILFNKFFFRYLHYIVLWPFHLICDLNSSHGGFTSTLLWPFLGNFPALQQQKYSGIIEYVSAVVQKQTGSAFFYEIVGFMLLVFWARKDFIRRNNLKVLEVPN